MDTFHKKLEQSELMIFADCMVPVFFSGDPRLGMRRIDLEVTFFC